MLEFKVYYNKTDYIHFYSKYSYKTGILIVFFLRTLRICSPNFLNEEFEHIKNSFSKLQYPKSFIHHTKSKATNIHKRTSYNKNKNNKPSSNINPIKRHNITPKSYYHPHGKKLKLLRHKNPYLHNKNNKADSKEPFQKHKFPIQHRCLQNPLPKLLYILHRRNK